jgi:hypothetical protein
MLHLGQNNRWQTETTMSLLSLQQLGIPAMLLAVFIVGLVISAIDVAAQLKGQRATSKSTTSQTGGVVILFAGVLTGGLFQRAGLSYPDAGGFAFLIACVEGLASCFIVYMISIRTAHYIYYLSRAIF